MMSGSIEWEVKARVEHDEEMEVVVMCKRWTTERLGEEYGSTGYCGIIRTR